MKNKLLLIGWDAADWKVINELMSEGRMPTLQRMVEQGASGNLRTLQPPFSPMLWTSIATGKRPFKHGIYGFTEPTPKGDAVQPVTNVSRTSMAIWNILNQDGRRSVVVGWWPSHPAEPIRGTMVSDFFHKAPDKPGAPWPLRENCVHPPERLRDIADLRVHPLELTGEDILPFVPDGADIDQTIDQRVSGIMKITAECSTVHAAATHLLQNEPWDFAAIYYDAIDHYSHGYMRYRAPQQKFISDHDHRMYRHVVDMGYVFHDMMLKQLLESTDENTTVMLISDHGFHSDHLRPEKLPNEPAGPAREHNDLGIIVATGPDIRAGGVVHGASLLDITPTILACCGLPVGEDMDGRVLEELFTGTPEVGTIESWEDVDGETGEHPPGFTISSEESKAAIDQLVALGYIDPPEADSSLAVVKCLRELDYNLSLSYMDADLHGEAAPVLLKLYREHPVELRFGIQLATCMQMMGDHRNLRSLLRDMTDRWGRIAKIARERVIEVEELTEVRRKLWEEFKKQDDAENTEESERMAKVDREGRPMLFEEDELLVIRKLRSLSATNPRSLDFLSSSAAAGEGDFEEALDLLKRARPTHAGDPTYHFHLGNTLVSLGRDEEAEKSFLAGLSFDDCHPKCHMGLGRCRVEMGRHREALESSLRAVDLQYQFPLAHYHAGLAHRGTGEIDAAVAALETAIEQNPNFEEAHAALAEIHETDRGDVARAAEHRSAATALAAENRRQMESIADIAFESLSTGQLTEMLPRIAAHTTDPEMEPALVESLPVTGEDDSSPARRPRVIVVSGLPRSGTSMMMQMLEAGGLPIFTDGRRTPDENNPKGYYEVDLARSLSKRNTWVRECDGKVLKVVAPLIRFLPSSVDYKVIHMQRPIEEIVRSQSRMLERLGKASSDLSDEQMGRVMRADVRTALRLLEMHRHPVLGLDYADVVADPTAAASAIGRFLESELDETAMARVVDPTLHREKSSSEPEAGDP